MLDPAALIDKAAVRRDVAPHLAALGSWPNGKPKPLP